MALFSVNMLEDEIFALSLQLADLQDSQAHDKGKYAEESPPDAVRALWEYGAELATCLQTLSDCKLAHSIAQAVATDGPAIAEFVAIELQAQEDRGVALETNGDNPAVQEASEAPPPYDQVDSLSCAALLEQQKQYDADTSNVLGDDDSWMSPEAAVCDDEGHAEDGQGSSHPRDMHQEAAFENFRLPKVECCACREQFRTSVVYRLDCGDIFCRQCLKKVILQSMQDKGAWFPPKCHRRPLSQDMIISVLSEQERQSFQDIELEVSSAIKTYCSNAECGRFVSPAQITADMAVCLYCDVSTCTTCNNAYHEGSGCPEDDEAVQLTLSLAADQQWQRCFACQAIVILARDCNHITCRCGAEFCYVCGQRWRTCTCAAFTEENLLYRAQEIVDRDAFGAPLRPQERQLRVEAVRRQLLAADECEHPGRFQRIFGSGRRRFRCEMCDARHWNYILQCRHCPLRVCEECRRHRV